MKILYLECNMGASGDMLMGALLELHPDPDAFLQQLNLLGLPGVSVTAKNVVKRGISGTSISVVTAQGREQADSTTAFSSSELTLNDIYSILSSAAIPLQVLKNTMAVYQSIASAESEVHGIPVEQVHFHELGMMDAIVDIVGVCLLIDQLKPDKIFVSPVNVGRGQIKCAHGILPVPAPATALLLKEIPIFSNAVEGELCTPTGAALLKYFSTDFGELPSMRVQSIGYGMGDKDFPTANCVRAFLGNSDTASNVSECIIELACNLDDMTPEAIGFATEILFNAGALDVFTTPIGMKKNRPGIILTCLCEQNDRDKILQLLFAHTTTLGIREYLCNRYTLQRTEYTLETTYGVVHVKKSSGWNVAREKVEYEDLARIARQQHCSLQQAAALLHKEEIIE